MDYVTLKLIHVSAVVLSFAGFFARGLGALRGAGWVRHRVTRVLPHIVDTVLLASALGMLWIVRLTPWATPWLRAKIIGLIAYVGLGALALRSASGERTGRPRARQLIAWLGALVVFGYIVSVALTKSPRGPLGWLQ